jgi:hypothetical protein
MHMQLPARQRLMTCRYPLYCTADASDGKSVTLLTRPGRIRAIMCLMKDALFVLTVASSAVLGRIIGHVITRRREWLIPRESHMRAIYLRGVDFRQAWLSNAHLSHAMLSESNLSCLANASLTAARLNGAHLKEADPSWL